VQIFACFGIDSHFCHISFMLRSWRVSMWKLLLQHKRLCTLFSLQALARGEVMAPLANWCPLRHVLIDEKAGRKMKFIVETNISPWSWSWSYSLCLYKYLRASHTVIFIHFSQTEQISISFPTWFYEAQMGPLDFASFWLRQFASVCTNRNQPNVVTCFCCLTCIRCK